jgi:cbb3-type cytochrome oxidase subunit 3
MIADWLTRVTSYWPRIGLVIFLVFFAAILIWTLRGGKHRFEHISRLPLEEKDPLDGTSHASQETHS